MQTSIGRTAGRAPLAPTAPLQRPRARVAARAYLEQERRAAGAAPAGYANQLEALKAMSVVVADTGEPDLVKLYKPGGAPLQGASRGP
ncbi:hypothetical protein MNEG_13748 [Monoraphidium neglectum]|jgi:hypothetical protein|uniref:Uncharacterized protein n=1 Tax=Monoraphidium neglectum TaxID=145388 RepID=A0A0D2KEI5_9CHLO|nr:hypothetical protein MNEG_13748 [Monoraphidium neglectum]KIY94213.1 hypothetical protein MNEG_13748 [Monoraphidium neglectum]|eukprot:XP_013893233.1 hypothetical protein MNEG_13748 [Monoraphidium neglectum]